MRARLVIVGDELLAGYTQDANGPFLARQLRRLGHKVDRLTVVPDTIEEIVGALEAAREHAGLLFICGGLGPTQDDRTIEAVARFLDRPLEVPEAGREQVRRIYQRGKEAGLLSSEEVDEAAWAMARIPEGGQVIANDQGVAPGSVHTLDQSELPARLYVLPGPPGELQSVFANLLEAGAIPAEEELAVQEVHLATFEAPVADELAQVAQRFPEVEVGSYPQHGEKRVIVRLTGEPGPVERAGAMVRELLGEIELEPEPP